MLLISGSFYFYAHRTSKLVYDQSRTTARLLVAPVMLANHSQFLQEEHPQQDGTTLQKTKEDFRIAIQQMASSLKPDELSEFEAHIVSAEPNNVDPTRRPVDRSGYEALEKIRAGKEEVIHIDDEAGMYHFYRALHAKRSCLSCHNRPEIFPYDRKVQEGEVLGMSVIRFPLDKTRQALAWNNAILLATAILTAFLAMIALWSIVRYVIVKPLLHLKFVADEIAKGNLDSRADIRTGDEFEKLSQAFNRMMRHLISTQTELKEVNTSLDTRIDELAQLNLRLHEVNSLKSEFLATMSHELRTPLNSILGFSDVLSESNVLDERQQRYLENIRKSGKDLKDLINDLLDLAKIESGKMAIQPSEFSVGDLVERQVISILPISEHKNIELTWDVAPPVSKVFQDSLKVQQIITNLVSNAVKFTPEGGRVHVQVNEGEVDFFEIIVSDTGIGIPLDEQGKIFEKFRQGQTQQGNHNALTREYGGTGLGLSIVKELSKLLGGEVELESEFGKGSTFTVRLPVRVTEEMLQESEELSLSEFETLSKHPIVGQREQRTFESSEMSATEQVSDSAEVVPFPSSTNKAESSEAKTESEQSEAVSTDPKHSNVPAKPNRPRLADE